MYSFFEILDRHAGPHNDDEIMANLFYGNYGGGCDRETLLDFLLLLKNWLVLEVYPPEVQAYFIQYPKRKIQVCHRGDSGYIIRGEDILNSSVKVVYYLGERDRNAVPFLNT